MKRILSFLAAAALVALGACHPEPILSVSPDSLSFSESGGSQTVQISANYPWTASVSGSGFSVSPSSGEGNGTVTVTAAAASSPDAATGTLSVRSEGLSASVSLSQAAKPTLILGDGAKVPAEGGSVELQIQYNTDYTVEVEASAQSWIKFIKTKSLSSGKLGFEISPNEGDERSGKVTVKDGSGKAAPVTATITQAAETKVLVVGDAATVPSGGATVEVDVKYNVDYAVEIESSAQSWIHYVETKAVKEGKLVFKVDANETTEERTGTVTLKDKSGKVSPVTITFTQEKALVINVGEPTVVPALGGPVVIPVEYNTEYDVKVEEPAQSWIRVVRTKALSSGEIELDVSENHGDERTGNVTVTALGGKVAPIVLTIVQEKSPEVEIRRVFMDFYDAMDGPNWKDNVGWGTDRPLQEWVGVSYSPYSGELNLLFNDNGLKGELPESIGELGGLLTGLVLQNEPGVVGRLPDSFRKLVNLRELNLYRTSMTSLPDVFADMKSLTIVSVTVNEKMTGPLPESIGVSPVLERLALVSDMFTGGVPASWAGLCGRFSVGENCLTGKLPAAILATKEYEWLQDDVLFQREGYGFDLSDVEVHGGRFWPKGMVEDLMGGDSFSFEDVIGRNKCTVYLNWSLWDPFSRPLMDDLKELYDLYHEDGLDIIATIMNSPDGLKPEEQRTAVEARGYDGWHHYFYPSSGRDDTISSVPSAEVYDSNGNIIYSSFSEYSDPVRDRFGKTASIDMVPFLLGIFEPETYTSTDYSMDGEVTTLQKASVGNGIDIVFMGDAFTDKDMGKGGLYETIMSQSMEEFFAIEPYKTFRNRFNVYAVKVVSPNGRVGDGYTTALGTVLAGGTEIWANLEKAEEYSLKVPSITDTENLLTCVMVRSAKYAGTCIMSRVKQSAVALTSTEGYDRALFGNTLRHEAGGHGFGFLSDEYYYYEETVPAEKKEEYTSLYEQFGWYSNVDFTDDPKKVRWSAFLSDSRYTDEVGVFEGGALYNFGVWRPSADSMMYENAEYFNAPSRWAIYKRIMELSGEEYSFETFLEYDAVNRGKAAAAPRPPLKAAARRHGGHTAPPVILP